MSDVLRPIIHYRGAYRLLRRISNGLVIGIAELFHHLNETFLPGLRVAMVISLFTRCKYSPDALYFTVPIAFLEEQKGESPRVSIFLAQPRGIKRQNNHQMSFANFVFRNWDINDAKAVTKICKSLEMWKYIRLDNLQQMPYPYTLQNALDFIATQQSEMICGVAIEDWEGDLAGGIHLEFSAQHPRSFAQLEFWVVPPYGPSLVKQAIKKTVAMAVEHNLEVVYSQSLHRKQVADNYFVKAGFTKSQSLSAGVPDGLDLQKGTVFVRS